MSLEILIAIATFVLTAIVSVWRINASQTKRMDQFSLSVYARIDALGDRLDARIDALGDRLDARIDKLDKKLDTKIDELRSEVRSDMGEFRSEVRSDIGEIRSMQRLLMDSMSKLIGRVSFIEGMLGSRQEPPVEDDRSSLEMAQE